MDGFEVTVDGLRDAGRVGGTLAGDLAALPLAEAARAVGEALPGGAACDAAAVLAGRWRVRVAATADGVAQHAAALRAAAAGYAAAERRAVVALAGES
jgi:hypothetical protein